MAFGQRQFYTRIRVIPPRQRPEHLARLKLTSRHQVNSLVISCRRLVSLSQMRQRDAIAYMGEQAFVRSLAKLSLDELKSVYAGTQQKLLGQLFGDGVQGARLALSSGRIPAGLTREAMMAYAEIARRYIEAGRDTTGVQALRLQIIKQALERLK